MPERRLIAVEGLVQGVGFRPFVHRLATTCDLRGSVRNAPSGVTIDVEGEAPALDRFIQLLAADSPFPAVIQRLRVTAAEPERYDRFVIADSESAPAATDAGAALVAPDLAPCDACVREIGDPSARRYRYPFTNCAQCGPRYTIVRDVPYDRARTTMQRFTMCEACRREYENPADRRFHAQPIACPACGPTLALRQQRLVATGGEALAGAVAALREGRIVAVKGLGGYHLACLALEPDVVARLRERKARDAKPFAVMVADLAAARRLCRVDAAAAQLLGAPTRPIVVLAQRADLDARTRRTLAALAPELDTLGLLLPYTPLHHLLLGDVGAPLVMTSGNRRDAPIVTEDDEASERLAGIADLLLTHDRPIATAADDSVIVGATGTMIRRSRGLAPTPIVLRAPASEPIMAVGGHQKNTFCLLRGRAAFLSHHIGDLDHPAAYAALRAGVARFAHLFGARGAVVAHDLHPDYLSTRLAGELSAERRIAVQHHHAHIAACLAEHGVERPAIGVAFDGAGYGTDGAVWGGEFLLVDGACSTRLGALRNVPLPGGDAAVREPWRSATAHLWAAFGGDLEAAPSDWRARRDPAKLAAIGAMLARGVASPPTSSAGRLFDAVASLVGLRDAAAFEGQAAMRLETVADRGTRRRYPVAIDAQHGAWRIDCAPLIRAVVEDVTVGLDAATIAGAFHHTLADLVLAGVTRVRDATGVRHVALSGGVFQNGLLTHRVVDRLTGHGFVPLVHAAVPPNDGGLALGQAWVASRCV